MRAHVNTFKQIVFDLIYAIDNAIDKISDLSEEQFVTSEAQFKSALWDIIVISKLAQLCDFHHEEEVELCAKVGWAKLLHYEQHYLNRFYHIKDYSPYNVIKYELPSVRKELIEVFETLGGTQTGCDVTFDSL